MLIYYLRALTAEWKVSKYRIISGPYFPIFGLNTEIYGVYFPTQSEYRKIRTRNNSVSGNFLRNAAALSIEEQR